MSNHHKCPFCRSVLVSGTAEGTLDGTNSITWDCGTNVKGNVVLPSDECKERINKRLEIKQTNVSEYVSMMKAIDPLLPERVVVMKEKTINFECKEDFKPKVMELMKKLGI